jgi:pyrrolidone-carboxylate peptidase
MARTRVLVTGFGPFETAQENPSGALASCCKRRHQVLPVSYDAARRFIHELDEDSFDALLLMGLNGDSDRFQREMLARNEIEERADVKGLAPRGPIRPDLPPTLQGTLWPILSLGTLMDESSLDVSFDAGAYLCNFIYFEALAKFPLKRVGFLHVPRASSMPISVQQQKVAILLKQIERLALPMPSAL